MRLSDSLINSEMNLDQQVQLTEEEDQDDILMIGGISIFLPFAQEEAENCVADDTTTTEEQSQLMMTVKRKLEQTLRLPKQRNEKRE
jgi:DNA topoisomerase VI subunit B